MTIELESVLSLKFVIFLVTVSAFVSKRKSVKVYSDCLYHFLFLPIIYWHARSLEFPLLPCQVPLPL